MSGGPQVGDRVQVAITGNVARVGAHGGPNLQIELDPDIIVAGDFCTTCGTPGVECEDGSHAWRDQVTTFEAPDRVVVLDRACGTPGLPQRAELDGDHVPDLLEAAADAIQDMRPYLAAKELRTLATVLRGSAPEMRAAVAATLTRPSVGGAR